MAQPKKITPRTETSYVRTYLDVLHTSPPKGRRTVEYLQGLVQDLPADIAAETDNLKRLVLVQRLLDAEQDLHEALVSVDTDQVEKQFLSAAPGFSERKGITYAAWRRMGVPARVLKAAGLR